MAQHSLTTTPTRYAATYIAPGTPYPDEPDVDMPVGWRVVGYAVDELAEIGDPDSAVVVIQIEQAGDPVDVAVDEEHVACRLADRLNAASADYPRDPDGWFARTGGLRGVELCPSCALDGGYGLAHFGREYLCPRCVALWSPSRDESRPVRTRIGMWIQRAKVWATSHPSARGRRPEAR